MEITKTGRKVLPPLGADLATALNRVRRKARNADKSLEKCKICGDRFGNIYHHVYRTHLMGSKEYQNYQPKETK